MTLPLLVPVVLAGGSGTRLWPLSRESMPKQFLRLGGELSLLQRSLRRLQGLPGCLPPLVLAREAHRFLVAEHLRAMGIADATILLEPTARNTAPATVTAALLARRIYGDEVQLLVLSADHEIEQAAVFRDAIMKARALARDDWSVTFGIVPARAETGYGYVECGEALTDGAFRVNRFVEKPDEVTAAGYLAAGRYLWNGGMFVLSAGSFLGSARQLEPAMLDDCTAALDQSTRDLDFVRLAAEPFKRARDVSIDYAFMERLERVATVRLDAGWDDIGSWQFLGKRVPDAHGNVAVGDTLLMETTDSLVYADARLVTMLGVRDLIVVETDDAVLVTTPDHSQHVKALVADLKTRAHPAATTQPLAHRPWGTYRTIAAGPRYQVKCITVLPGQKLSLQLHHHRAEHWVVVRGTARVTRGDEVMLLSENESVYIPLGERHRLENPGRVPLELIEVQSGGYLDEDDIVRFADDYGRGEG